MEEEIEKLTGILSSSITASDINNKSVVQKILDSFPFYVLLIDSNHKILLANAAVQKDLGLNPLDIVGHYCPKVVHGMDTPFPGCPLEESIKTNRSIEKEVYDEKYDKWFTSCIYKTGLFTDENNELFLHVIKDITERKKIEEILFLSYRDQLTGLYNRRFFKEELKRLDTKRQLPISIIMADVDRLKYTNDFYGHEKGDKLLIAASEIIKNSCRKEDIITRWGGDEFIIFLPKTTENDARDVIDRIRKTSKVQKLGDKTNISISLGLSTKNDLNENMDHIIEQADKNMYDDKASKKNKDIR